MTSTDGDDEFGAGTVDRMARIHELVDRPDVDHARETVELTPAEYDEAVGRGEEGDAGVGAVVRDGEGRVVLVCNQWSEGWVFPGGIAAYGEPLPAAAEREVREETGLDADVERPLLVVEQTFTDGDRETTGHFVLYEARAADPGDVGDPGDLGADDHEEIHDVAWFGAVPEETPRPGRIREYLLDR